MKSLAFIMCLFNNSKYFSRSAKQKFPLQKLSLLIQSTVIYPRSTLEFFTIVHTNLPNMDMSLTDCLFFYICYLTFYSNSFSLHFTSSSQYLCNFRWEKMHHDKSTRCFICELSYNSWVNTVLSNDLLLFILSSLPFSFKWIFPLRVIRIHYYIASNLYL